MSSQTDKAAQLDSGNFKPELEKRYKIDQIFKTISWIATFSGLVVLAILLIGVLVDGIPSLSLEFLTSPPSRRAAQAGFWPAFVGSICLLLITASVAFPIGVGSGIFLQEFAQNNKFARIVEINISNLAAVPSIIYGLLGLFVFARLLENIPGTGLPLTGGRSILSAGLTLALLILPVIIVATREALKAVPDSIRLAGMALGSTRWQTVRTHVLPQAIPGIMTGTILGLSRAIGETAPIIVVGAAAFVPFAPDISISGFQEPAFTAMPIQIYSWISRPQEEFHSIAASGIIILMLVLFTMNATAVFLRNRFQRSS